MPTASRYPETVKVTGSPSGHIAITPASGVTNNSKGSFTFTVSDTTSETVTFTGIDVSDGVVLRRNPRYLS